MHLHCISLILTIKRENFLQANNNPCIHLHKFIIKSFNFYLSAKHSAFTQVVKKNSEVLRILQERGLKKLYVPKM